MDIHPQEVITKDNVEIKFDGIIWVRPGYEEEDIKKTFYNIDNLRRTGSRALYILNSIVLFVLKDIFHAYGEGFCDSKCEGQ